MSNPATSPLARLEMAPRDPILGITEAYNADRNPKKTNLGVGVYSDDAGKVPLLECVRRAEAQLMQAGAPHTYLPIDGLAAYNKAVRALLFGADSATVRNERAITIQALGGTGGLKIGADFLRRIAPKATVWISDPSWANHRALFEAAGFPVRTYPYYHAASHGLDFPGLLAALDAMPAGDVVLLHACCHNPTGVDPTPEQWSDILARVSKRGLLPFLDIAYQGFAEGIEADGAVVRRFAEAGGPLLVSSSFSKSFSLYGERTGAFSLVAADRDEAARALSQLKRLVRTNYSNPPRHGGQIVATVLNTPELRALWDSELTGMRDRIRLMRQAFVEQLRRKTQQVDFSFVLQQRGMFSYSGLTKAQVARLRDEYSIYAVDSGRICVAALNNGNIDYVTDAIAKVIA